LTQRLGIGRNRFAPDHQHRSRALRLLQLVAVELSQALSDFGARDRLLLAHEGMLERPSQGRQFTHGFRRLDQLVDRRLELGSSCRHDLAQHRQRSSGRCRRERSRCPYS